VAAGVAVVGWLLLELLKGTVVVVAFALGISMIAVPLLFSPRIVRGHRGSELRERWGTIGTVVAIGVLLCAVAQQVDDHGWLLIVLPAAAVVLARLVRAGGDLRRRMRSRRQPSGGRPG